MRTGSSPLFFCILVAGLAQPAMRAAHTILGTLKCSWAKITLQGRKVEAGSVFKLLIGTIAGVMVSNHTGHHA
jgi:hypothetical protein